MWLSHLFYSRLYRKYLISFTLLVLGVLVAGGASDLYFSYYEVQDAAIALQEEKAGAAAIRIDQFISDIEQQVSWTMMLPRKGVSLIQRQTEFIKLLRQAPAITNVMWLDAEGRERVRVSRLSLDRLNSGQDFSSTEAFKQASNNRKYYSPVHFNEGTEPYLDMAFTAGEGVTLIEVNLKFVWDVISGIHFGKTGHAYVVDSSGQLISHPDISLVLRKTSLSSLPQVQQAMASQTRVPSHAAHARNFLGKPAITAFTPIASIDWFVLVEQQESEAFAPLYASMLRTIIMILLGLILSIAISAVLARRMVKPIQALQAGASRIDAGALDQTIDIDTGDELEALAQEFNRMALRLRESYAGLEQKVAERTEQLESANRAKSRFLAAASHDLRQPMHALGLFVAQLNHIDISPEAKHLSGRIEVAVTALQSLLDALLDVSRLDAGIVTPNLSSVSVSHLLDRIETTFAPDATAREIHFRIARCNLVVHSDPILLERILINLVANALRYTQRGSILIGCRHRGEHARIEVWDTGIGIPPEHQQAIFQEFYQVANPERDRSKGLGLGLSIAGRLARLLGGRIDVHSMPGKGSVFAVQVPLNKTPVQADQFAEDIPGMKDLDGALILVVEDDALVRESIEGIISQWGCRVSLAASGEEALALSSRSGHVPDAIICDYRLPENETGIEVIARLRSQLAMDIPAALITGDTDPEHLREAKAQGFLLMHKPLQPARLRMLLEHLLA